MNKAIFIDKDGTLIIDVPYNANPQHIRLHPGAAVALQQLQQAGYLLIVISNQAGVALGYFEEEALPCINEKIQHLLQPYGVQIDAFYYCPHHPTGTVAAYTVACNCRKPAPGLLLQAMEAWNIDAHASWMVGDILNDAEAGNRAGCRTILLNNGNETEWLPGPYRQPDGTVADWAGIPKLILAKTQPVAHDQ